MGFMPSFEDLENPQNNLASQVFSADGELLGHMPMQNRTYVEFDDISENIVNALLATEDIRFRNHAGIDARGLARVIVKSVILQAGCGWGKHDHTAACEKSFSARYYILPVRYKP
jgi:penicillin-binding protein 1A